MTFFKSHQKLHIWLLADLVLLAAFWIAREHRDWMNALERFVSAPIRRSLGSLCYRVSLLCDGGAVCPGGRPRAGLCGMEHHGGSQGQRAAEAPGLQRGSGGRSAPG